MKARNQSTALSCSALGRTEQYSKANAGFEVVAKQAISEATEHTLHLLCGGGRECRGEAGRTWRVSMMDWRLPRSSCADCAADCARRAACACWAASFSARSSLLLARSSRSSNSTTSAASLCAHSQPCQPSEDILIHLCTTTVKVSCMVTQVWRTKCMANVCSMGTICPLSWVGKDLNHRCAPTYGTQQRRITDNRLWVTSRHQESFCAFVLKWWYEDLWRYLFYHAGVATRSCAWCMQMPNYCQK